MKKLLMKTLIIAILCSVAMSNSMQAVGLSNRFLSGVNRRIGDWSNLISTQLSGLMNHPAVVPVLLYGKRGKRAAMLIAVGAGIVGVIKMDRWWRSKPKNDYEGLYNAILAIPDRCENKSINKSIEGILSEEGRKEAREIFERYMPTKWSIPITKVKVPFPSIKIKFMESFIDYCKKELKKAPILQGVLISEEGYKIAFKQQYKVIKVLTTAIRYLKYLKKPWVTKRAVMAHVVSFSLGGVITGVVALKLIGKL